MEKQYKRKKIPLKIHEKKHNAPVNIWMIISQIYECNNTPNN